MTVMRVLLFVLGMSMLRECEGDRGVPKRHRMYEVRMLQSSAQIVYIYIYIYNPFPP